MQIYDKNSTGFDSVIEPYLMAGLKAGNSGSSATLIEKTITENGEYSAADDNVDGYSSVNVNVKNQIHSLYCSFTNANFGLLCSNNGEYNIPNSRLGIMLSYCILSNPATKVIVDTDICSSYYFTPGDSFEVFDNGSIVELEGDAIVPNDGKTYTLSIGGGPTGAIRYTIIKSDNDFIVTIS